MRWKALFIISLKQIRQLFLEGESPILISNFSRKGAIHQIMSFLKRMKEQYNQILFAHLMKDLVELILMLLGFLTPNGSFILWRGQYCLCYDVVNNLQNMSGWLWILLWVVTFRPSCFSTSFGYTDIILTTFTLYHGIFCVGRVFKFFLFSM